MGKYIKKFETAREVAVTELSQSSLGVRTRSKTLALQRQKKSSTSPATVASAPANGAGSYLQLRSRRLKKPPFVLHHHDSKKNQQQQQRKQGSKKDMCGQNPNPNSDSRARVSYVSNSVVEKKTGGKSGREDLVQEDNVINYTNISVEASVGENILDIEAKERGTRELTPCSLIRDPESIRAPGSTTRLTNSADANQRIRYSTTPHILTSHEMDEFFALAELDQQRQFIEKYNFDPVKDKPLPGRYQWEKVNP